MQISEKFLNQVLANLPAHSTMLFVRGDLTEASEFTPDDEKSKPVHERKTFRTIKVAAIGSTFKYSCRDEQEFDQLRQLEGDEVGMVAQVTAADGKNIKIVRLHAFVGMADVAEQLAGKKAAA